MTKSTTKNIILAGAVIIVILIAAKFLFFSDSTKSEETITSTGTSEITTTPDLAEIYARIEVLEQTAQEAEEKSKEISDAVLEAAKSFSDAKVETTSYNIYKREDWSEEGPIFKGYTAMYSLKISTKNLDDTGEITDAVVQAGANNIDNIQFTLSYEKEQEVKKEALKKAGEQAKERAEAIAEGLGFEIGKIVSVSESNIYYPPYMFDKVVAEVAAGGSASDLTFEPADIKVSATINVVYSIED